MATTLTPTERTIRNTRRVLTGGRWFLITGLVFYSLMTTTPFVQRHSEWRGSGWVLGLIVDAAFIMALSAESTLAKYGITNLGAWPMAFRWITGASAVFLNIWASVEARNWVGVAVHLIAPALVMLLAEVGPVYMAALAHAEAVAEPEREAAESASKVLPEPEADDDEPEINEPLREAAQRAREVISRVPDPLDVADEFAREAPGPKTAAPKLSKAESDKIIEAGWQHRATVKQAEVAQAAGVSPATVSRRWKILDAELSV